MRRLSIIGTFLVIILLIVLPFAGIAVGAFQEGPRAFLTSLTRPEAVHAMAVSLEIVIAVTLLNTAAGIVFSLELVRGTWLSAKLKPILNAVADLPFAVSPVIGGLMIVLLYGPETIIGTFFELMGLKIVYAIPGMILATLFITFPLMVREIAPLLSEIGQQSEEASATLGAGPFRTFGQVTWPSIRWGVYYGIALTVARALGEFGAVLVVSGNIMNQTQTATTLVYQDAENFNLLAANSLSLVLGTVSILILLTLEWMKKRKGRELHAY